MGAGEARKLGAARKKAARTLCSKCHAACGMNRTKAARPLNDTVEHVPSGRCCDCNTRLKVNFDKAVLAVGGEWKFWKLGKAGRRPAEKQAHGRDGDGPTLARVPSTTPPLPDAKNKRRHGQMTSTYYPLAV